MTPVLLVHIAAGGVAVVTGWFALDGRSGGRLR
jgi:hypothetical protein